MATATVVEITGDHAGRPGTAFSNHSGDEKLFHAREHESLPWIESPLKYASGDDLYFHPREQASMIELFFDLFFVANLATFTALHGIVDLDTLYAYLGFFTIIWFTWLQITIHDVRFAIDSFYERVCKFIQFLVFVGFALVGYNFEPSSTDDISVYETLCFILFISRALLMVQYGVVLVYVTKSSSALVKPMLLIVSTFVVSTVAFLAMIIASHTGTSNNIYYLWYVLSFLEAAAILTASGKWKALGFRKTHLLERIGLLSMIVVGEGVIGVTKTIGKLMGSAGPDIRSVQQVISIIALLMFLWQIYFDNHPHEHLGTIREIIWVALHFPLHVAFVGIVEGAQQLAIAWKTWSYFQKFEKVVAKNCKIPGLDSEDLTNIFNATIYKFGFDKNIYSAVLAPSIKKSLTAINQTADICAFHANDTDIMIGNVAAVELDTLSQQVLGALYLYNKQEIPLVLNGQLNPTAADVFFSSYYVVFGYVFCSLGIMFVTSAITIFFIRRYHRDIFEYIRIGIRLVAMGLCLAVANSRDAMIPTFRNYGISLIVILSVIFMVVAVDRVLNSMGMKRAKRMGMGTIHIQHEEGMISVHQPAEFSMGSNEKHHHVVEKDNFSTGEVEVRELPRPESALERRVRSLEAVVHCYGEDEEQHRPDSSVLGRNPKRQGVHHGY